MKVNEAIEFANRSRYIVFDTIPFLRVWPTEKKETRLSLSFDTPRACRPSEFNLWKSQQIATGFVARPWVPFHGGFLINKNNHRTPRGMRIRDIAFRVFSPSLFLEIRKNRPDSLFFSLFSFPFVFLSSKYSLQRNHVLLIVSQSILSRIIRINQNVF